MFCKIYIWFSKIGSNFSALKLKGKDFVGYEVCKYTLNKGNQFHRKLTTPIAGV